MLVVLSSVTSAQRLKKLLAAKKIASDIIQTPRNISVGGCSYSLKTDKSNLSEIIALSEALHISVKKIYHENP